MAKLTIYLSDEEKKAVAERAEAVGISMSEYARLAVIDRAKMNKLRVEKGHEPGRENW